MDMIVSATLDVAQHLQGAGIVALLLGIVCGTLRAHWLAGGHRG